MSNVIIFGDAHAQRRRQRQHSPSDPETNMHTVQFRSYELIEKASDRLLVRDVGNHLPKAVKKLAKIRDLIRTTVAASEGRIAMLRRVEAKLGAAVDEARKESLPQAMAERENFEEMMRQRITEVASHRGLSAEDIRPALTLKHYEIARFLRQYEIKALWLFEGAGPIWK